MADITDNVYTQQYRNLVSGLLNDATALRAAVVALTAKLDTDFAAQNVAVTASTLDVDYAAAVNPPALETTL